MIVAVVLDANAMTTPCVTFLHYINVPDYVRSY